KMIIIMSKYKAFKNLNNIITHNFYVRRYLKHIQYANKVFELFAFSDGKYLNEEKWRKFKYMNETQTFLKVQSEIQAFEAAKFLSSFHAHVSDIEIDRITDSIDGFLDFEMRLGQYDKALKKSASDRHEVAEAAVVFIKENKIILEDWLTLLPQIPTRIIHADPKISNFLFDQADANRIVALIDWDTILRGSI